MELVGYGLAWTSYRPLAAIAMKLLLNSNVPLPADNQMADFICPFSTSALQPEPDRHHRPSQPLHDFLSHTPRLPFLGTLL